jgi:hypothetical protein
MPITIATVAKANEMNTFKDGTSNVAENMLAAPKAAERSPMIELERDIEASPKKKRMHTPAFTRR